MKPIVEVFGEVVASMRKNYFDPTFDETFGPILPIYMYGHRGEIANRVMKIGADRLKKGKRFPLIALRLDTEEVIEDGMRKFDLNIALVTISEKGLNAEERYAKVFIPTLYPLYDLLMSKIKAVGKFSWEGDQQLPPHSKIDRPYYGTEDTELNVKNLFNDPTDAIEILNLKINQRINC